MPFKNCSLYAGVNFEDLNRKQNTFKWRLAFVVIGHILTYINTQHNWSSASNPLTSSWGAALSFSDSWKDVTATKLTTTHFLCSGELSVCKSGLWIQFKLFLMKETVINPHSCIQLELCSQCKYMECLD